MVLAQLSPPRPFAEQIVADTALMQQTLLPLASERIAAYIQLLAKWNRTYNLTAVRDVQDMRVRHVLDSLAVRPWIKSGGSLVDVGSGPGLPGILLALADATLDVTLIDSNLKMTRFAEAAVRTLSIDNVRVIRGRVEAIPASSYDQVISRAFATPSDFLKLTAHLARPGGEWLAMRGRQDHHKDGPALPSRFICRKTIPLVVPGLNAQRHLQIYQQEVAS